MTLVGVPSPETTEVDLRVCTDSHVQLFATEAYNTRNLDDTAQYFRADYHSGDRLVGTFVGVVDGDLFWSGYRAPFCGPDLVRQRETPGNVQDLIDHTMDLLRARGVARFRVTARPMSYSLNETYVQHAFLRRGLSVVESELSYAIDLERFGSRTEYRAALKSPARRAVRHSDNEPYEYSQAQTDAEWALAYGLIQANRAAKGNPLGLSLEYLLQLQGDFGDRIRFFVLRHDGEPVASALLYRLRPDIELVEYWGDKHSLDRSPMNRIADEVCGRAIEEGVRLVDLGISSVDGAPDEGLIQFKQSIGATAELRLTFEGKL